MDQYVIQIQIAENGENVGWLVTSFKVTGLTPIPENVPPNIMQIVMTNTDSFNSIVAVYNEYTTAALFSYDEQNSKIDCSGAVTDSWPIN